MRAARRLDRMDHSAELLPRFCGPTAAAPRVSILSKKSRRELKRIETGHGALLTSMTIHATLCTEQALYFVSLFSPLSPPLLFLSPSFSSVWCFCYFSSKIAETTAAAPDGVNFVRRRTFAIPRDRSSLTRNEMDPVSIRSTS